MQGSATFKGLLQRSLQSKTSNYFFGETHYGNPRSLSNNELNCTEYCTQTVAYKIPSAPSSPLLESKMCSRPVLRGNGLVPEQGRKLPFNRSLCKIDKSKTNRFFNRNNGKQHYPTSIPFSGNRSIDMVSQPSFGYNSSSRNASPAREKPPVVHYDDEMLIDLAMFKLEVAMCTGQAESPKSTNFSPKPSKEQLILTKLKLAETLPEFFESSSKHPFEIYSKNLIFDNRINGTKSSGLTKYISQAVLFKNYTRLKFSSAKFVILSVTSHDDDNTIKLRWRIVGVPHKVFQYLSLSKSNSKNEPHDAWYDGFSIFHLGTDGLIHMHEVDMVMQDEEREYMQKMSLGSQIAIALGLTPKPDISNSNIAFITNDRRKT